MNRELLQQALDYISTYIGVGDHKADNLYAALKAEMAKPTKPAGWVNELAEFLPLQEKELMTRGAAWVTATTHDWVPLYMNEPPIQKKL